MSRRAREESATPARNTRARSQTPLPGLATKQSHAYGAQGKTNLHTQVRASGSNFAEEFTTGRVTRRRAGSVQRSEEPEGDPRAASPAKKGGVRERKGRQQRTQPIIDEESEEDADEDGEDEEQAIDSSRIPTALSQEAAYGQNSATEERAGVVYAVQEPSAWRYFSEISHAMTTAFLLAALVFAWLPLSGWWDEFRFDTFWGLGMFLHIPGYGKPPAFATEMWYRVRHNNLTSEMLPGHNMPEIQWAVNLNTLERLNAAEISQQDLRSMLGLQDETLEYLKSILPVTVIVREDKQGYEIPRPFFEALGQKIAQGGDEVAPLWDSFISTNQEQIKELSLQAATQIVGDAVATKQLITRKEFAEILEQQNLELAAQWTREYRRMWEQNFETAREVSRKTTEETMERFTTHTMVKQQLDVLAKAVDLQNTYEALRTYNWFNYGEGAIIDPHFTSPTAELGGSRGWFSQFWGTSGSLYFTQNPPVTVLQPWLEVTDCWCAAPAPDGSAQVTMLTHEQFYPDRLVIEHIPAGGTRNINTAPRTIEIWADTGSAGEAQRLGEVMEETVPYPSQQACTNRPTERHLCLGRGEYNIHHHNHVQSFPMWTDTKSIGLAVNSFTVRIVNNWGGPRTCLYRLRMVGDEGRPQDGLGAEQ